MRCRRPRPSLCTCPLAVRLSCGVGRAFSLPVDRTSPRGSLAEPVCFLPRHTGRPSRSQICFPRGSSLAAALRMRTSGTRCWRSSGSARAPTRGAGVSPAGLACDGSQPSHSNKVRLVEMEKKKKKEFSCEAIWSWVFVCWKISDYSFNFRACDGSVKIFYFFLVQFWKVVLF